MNQFKPRPTLTHPVWALVTIPHTATRFTLKHLKLHFATTGIPLTRSHRDFIGSVLYQHHCHTNALPWVEQRHSEGVRIVTTDRPLADIQSSWDRRYGKHPGLEALYTNWQRHIVPMADCIIRLDGSELEQIQAFVGEWLG